MKKHFLISILLLQFVALHTFGQVIWPENQKLPSFPDVSPTMDFIYMNGSVAPFTRNWKWQAEAVETTHATGRAETDGWICAPNTDTANQYMLVSAGDNTVTMGENVAEFRLRIDNNSQDDNVVAVLDVRNVTTNRVLVSKNLTRKEFSAAGSYVSIKMDFMMPADSQYVEMRVLWKGNATLKADWVGINQNNSSAEQYLFSTMKGIVNKTKPRIFAYDGDAFAEGPYTWMQSLGLRWVEQSSGWVVLNKYRKEISGLIIYDPTQIHTVNLATTLAKDLNAVVAAPSLISRLTSTFGFPILLDLRGKYTSKLQVYQDLFDNHWNNTDKRLLIGLNPEVHKASLREYATAIGTAVIWLDPEITAESSLLNRFLSSMPAGANYMGWWPEEQPGVMRGSQYGIPTIPSDFCTNLTVHSGTSRTINIKPIPAKPVLENKIYVAFILSDGDNLQYIEHLMRKLWNNSDRGSVPMGWTISPAMVDAMPGALNYLHKSSTDNDNLVSGPSGLGYTYPNYWTSQSILSKYISATEAYNKAAGLRVVTVWNTITGGINQNVGQNYANNAPTLLGMTAQNTGGPLSVYNVSLPGMPLSCNYCSGEQAMKDHIASASSGWNKTSPRFVIIQAAPWGGVTPTSFKNVKNSLGSDYSVVRPDHLFMLMREANKLTVNPGGIEGSGDGLAGTYFNGTNFETEVLTRNDSEVNFNWAESAPAENINTDGFSVRWTGSVQPRYSGTYTFYTTSDNGSRLWINDQLLIDRWTTNTGSTYSATIALEAGQKYNIKLEYFDNTGNAKCILEWASGMQAREIVPKSQLYTEVTSLGKPNHYQSSDVFISPNPVVGGKLNITSAHVIDNNASVTLFDLCGKAVLHSALPASGVVNIGTLTRGTYVASIVINSFKYNKKILVQ